MLHIGREGSGQPIDRLQNFSITCNVVGKSPVLQLIESLLPLASYDGAAESDLAMTDRLVVCYDGSLPE